MKYVGVLLGLIPTLVTAGIVVVQRPHIPKGGGNSAPVITVPGSQDTPWQGTETFAGTISISDADGGTPELTATVSHGTFSLSGTTGLGFSVGDGTSDAVMTFTGSITNINNALNGLVYTPTSGFAGHSSLPMTFPPDELEIDVDDGAGGTDSESVVINVVSGGEVLKITADLGTVFQTVDGSAAGTGDPVGEAEDQSGEGNHATQGTAGARPTLSSDVPAALGGAGGDRRSLDFDGSDDSMPVSGMTRAYDGPISLVFWNYVADLSNENGIGGFGTDAAADRFFTHAPYTDGNLYWDYGANSGAGRISASYSGKTAKWTHVALVSSGAANTLKAIYLDGTLANSAAASDGPSGDVTFSLGAGVSYFHEDKLDDVRIYDFVISSTQVGYLNAGGP